MTAAICYIATDGYLFQTFVSALQAQQSVPAGVEVVLIRLGDGHTRESEIFQQAATAEGIELISLPMGTLEGVPPKYARLFLDEMLPDRVTDLLYLDGDTQIVGDLAPLLAATPPPGGVSAVRDPMVYLREANLRWRSRIDGWWDRAQIDPAVRARYINAGVLRIRRHDVAALREDALAVLASGRDLHFADQDVINIALGARVQILPLAWNFPGFLVDTPLHELAPPRLVHFMSNPRPWEAPFAPWGQAAYAPYGRLVAEHPDLAPYWSRAPRRTRARYGVQQAYKRVVERPLWSTAPVLEAFRRLASTDAVL